MIHDGWFKSAIFEYSVFDRKTLTLQGTLPERSRSYGGNFPKTRQFWYFVILAVC